MTTTVLLCSKLLVNEICVILPPPWVAAGYRIMLVGVSDSRNAVSADGREDVSPEVLQSTFSIFCVEEA